MIILITGITSGFGKAMAAQLAKDGHTVYGTHRHATTFLPGVHYIKAEVTLDADCEAAVRQVIEAEGRLDVFISNAGMGIGGPLECCSLDDARRQMDVNWMGMVRFLHFVLPVMRRQGSGKIICVSSIGGLMGLPFQGLYSASKYAIEGYCEALRLELRGTGVTVTVLEPGDFATSFTASRSNVSAEEAHAAYPSYRAALDSIEHDETHGLKPEVLARKVSRIVRCRKPRYNYVIATFVQKLSILLKAILPKPLFAALLAWFYKMK